MTGALSFLDPLHRLAGVRVDFVPRLAGIEVDGERDEVLERLRPAHRERVEGGFGAADWWRAEQVHGREVAVVAEGTPRVIAGVDGLVTAVPGAVLGIYVADCGPIWLADRRTGAVGLLHSGRKGTELGILESGLETMASAFGTRPDEVTVVLGPCIRPPDYEVDFAAEIGAQADRCGVAAYHDARLNTGADLDTYYSYRVEKGRTGRMLALIMREA